MHFVFSYSYSVVCDLSGLGRLGAEIALINFNLRNESLIHTLKISSAKYLFMGQSKYLLLISHCNLTSCAT